MLSNFCCVFHTNKCIMQHFSHMAVPFQSLFCYFRGHLDHSGLFLECVHFGYDPSLSHCTSISASLPPLLLVVLLVLSLLPRSLHHTTELVWPQFCKPFPSVSLASSCHTTLHCISSSFSILHSLCVISVAMPPVSSTLEPRYLKCTLFVVLPLTGSLPWLLSCPNVSPWIGFLVCWSSSLCPLMPSSRSPSTLSCMSRHHRRVQCLLQTTLVQVRSFSHPLSTCTSIRSKNMYNLYPSERRKNIVKICIKKTTFETLVCKSLQNTFQSHIISNDSGYW